MKFTTAAACESVVWEMRLADYPRSLNRSRLNSLYNGAPPYSDDEQRQNRFATNVNFLEGTKILHDARRQFANAFGSAERLFTINLDYGPAWKRREWSSRITREINKPVCGSRRYLDVRDSIFALDALHGIGPSNWEDRYLWCPKALGIEDVLVPSNTLTSLENLPFFAVYRQYTGYELYRRTHGPKVDPAWNMPLVERAIDWVDKQAQTLMSSSWPEVWSPEKMTERIKQDGGLYASDAVPTIDTFDIYFWDDEGKKAGWKRRVILDAWGEPGYGGVGGVINHQTSQQARVDKYGLSKNGSEFLYDSGDRIYAPKLEEIIHFQFADCSCVAPFRYHSVRSLGFLLYAVCHLSNRLRCRFNDSVFEALLQYFRVGNPADAERLSKLDLVHMGIIPDGLEFVKAADRWQVPAPLAEQAMQLLRQTMADNSASFTQDFDFTREDQQETATRTMAKVNATAALVGSMLNKAYNQQQFQYREIARRFCIKNSKDPDVRKFRVECLKAGVPEEALCVERWDVQPVRVIGSGNKMLQVAMADKLMAIRPLLDPDGQKEITRLYILANSDDPDLPERLVPEARQISDSVHDAQMAVGTLMQGIPVSMEKGMNHSEYIEVWLHAMALLVKRIETEGGMAPLDDIIGLNNLGQHIAQHIQALAQDKAMASKVKEYNDNLAKLMNLVKAYAQRLQEQRGKQAGQAGMDPKDAAKIQATIISAKTKADLAKQSHAQRTAQRQIQFEQKMQQDAQRHQQEMVKDAQHHAADMRREQMRSFEE